MIARVALTSISKISVNRLVESVRRQAGGTWTITDPENRSGKMSFRIGETQVQMATSSKPIRWQDQNEVFRNSDQWLTRKTDLQHSCNIAFRVSGPSPAWERASQLTRVVLAALEQCPNAIGIYWESARQLVPVDVFRRLASDENVVANIWVVSVILAKENDSAEGFTQGLIPFIGRELESCDSQVDSELLRARFRGLIGYLARKGVATDGESLGQSGEIEITARFNERSAFGIEGPVIKLVNAKRSAQVQKPVEPESATYSIPGKEIRQPRELVKKPIETKETDSRIRSKPFSTKVGKETSPVSSFVSDKNEVAPKSPFKTGSTKNRNTWIYCSIAIVAGTVLLGLIAWSLNNRFGSTQQPLEKENIQTQAEGHQGDEPETRVNSGPGTRTIPRFQKDEMDVDETQDESPPKR